jgi:zinc transporter ZupT
VFIIFSVNQIKSFPFVSLKFFLGGVLIGGQIDTTTLWLLLGAICLHMSLVSFSVALRLLIDNQSYIQVFYVMSSWSIMGSLGVFVSLIISANSSGLNSANGILQCLSAGTFVYITFIDMVHDDLIKRIFYPFINIILIFIGFLIIVLTNLWHKHPY